MKLRTVKIIGCISFCLLMVLAVLFYKERTVFSDIAFHLFLMAKEGNFAIQNNRFGAVFTQLFPLLAVKMNAPLETVMLIYSIGFILYYFLIFLLIAFVFRDKEIALICLLWPVLFVTHTFYWMQSELPQGIAFMLIFFSFYRFSKQKKENRIFWKILLFAMLVILAGFHPLLIIPFLFVVLFEIINSTETKTADYAGLIFYSLAFLILIALKSYFARGTGYEANALSGLNNFKTFFPHYFNLQSNRNFILNCFRYYYFLPIVLGLVLVLYLRKRQFTKNLLVFLFFAGYLLLINVCYPDNTTSHYIENLYLPLSIIVLYPFVTDLLPGLKPKVSMALISIIMIAGIARIYFAHARYSDRLNWEENYLSVHRHEKLFVDSRLVPMDTLIEIWGSPYEFWLLSTSEYDTTASILITGNIPFYQKHLPENKALFLTYGAFPYNELNTDYFKMTDTSEYKILSP